MSNYNIKAQSDFRHKKIEKHKKFTKKQARNYCIFLMNVIKLSQSKPNYFLGLRLI